MKKIYLYITHHSNTITLKLLLRPFILNDPSAIHIAIQAKPDQYFILSSLCQGYTSEILVFNQYTDLLNHIQTLGKIFQISGDANLKDPSGPSITDEMRSLIRESATERVILFMSTPACLVDAKRYLQGEIEELPIHLKRGMAAMREDLGAEIFNKSYLSLVGPQESRRESSTSLIQRWYKKYQKMKTTPIQKVELIDEVSETIHSDLVNITETITPSFSSHFESTEDSCASTVNFSFDPPEELYVSELNFSSKASSICVKPHSLQYLGLMFSHQKIIATTDEESSELDQRMEVYIKQKPIPSIA